MSEDVKPCPFCGCIADYVPESFFDRERVRCRNQECLAVIFGQRSKAAWNSRKEPA